MSAQAGEQICNGCGNRRPRGHCIYPSNPAANVDPKKRDELSVEPRVVERRRRSRAIRAQNGGK